MNCRKRRKPPPGMLESDLYKKSASSQYHILDFAYDAEPDDLSAVDNSPERVIELQRDIKIALMAANGCNDKLDVLREENDKYFERCQTLKKNLSEKESQASDLRRELVRSKADSELMIRALKEVAVKRIKQTVSQSWFRNLKLQERRVVDRWKEFRRYRTRERERCCGILGSILNRKLLCVFLEILQNFHKPVLSLFNGNGLRIESILSHDARTQTERIVSSHSRSIDCLDGFHIPICEGNDASTATNDRESRSFNTTESFCSLINFIPPPKQDIELHCSPVTHNAESQSDLESSAGFELQLVSCLEALKVVREKEKRQRGMIRVLWDRLHAKGRYRSRAGNFLKERLLWKFLHVV